MKTHHVRLALWCFFLLSLPVATHADTSYCHDVAANSDWERLVSRHEGDSDYIHLYTLRKDLCRQVDTGQISLDDAIDRFEAERERVIKEKLEKQEKLCSAPGGSR